MIGTNQTDMNSFSLTGSTELLWQFGHCRLFGYPSICDVKFFVPNKKNINMLNDTPDACLDFVNSLLLLVTNQRK